ncbi:hypothetical protein NE237_003080 [Protea cynaroides]|uniref:DNA polymerase epsilon catalytic subunit n=1 Tax=Protea cynaroides TaxID=273540 RepID=A0A9Q0KGQ8_9MAGN|nr:hypothetical protein NE237_003080 [Protea cynaroides]
MGCRMKLVFLGFLLTLRHLQSTTDGAVSTSIMKKIREVNKKGHYLGIVVPNFFEMSPLLQSSSFVADEKLSYVDFSVIKRLFKTIDLDSDGYLSRSELIALIIGIQFEEIDFNKDDAVEKLIIDFDTTHDHKLDEDEFVNGISRWINVAKKFVVLARTPGPHTTDIINDFHQQIKQEHYLLGDISDEAAEAMENSKWISIKAASMLLLGTVVAAAFADPLLDAVDNFSSATSIPSFFISFIVLPVATKSSEAVSTLIFASRKTEKTASLTFSEYNYGGIQAKSHGGSCINISKPPNEAEEDECQVEIISSWNIAEYLPKETQDHFMLIVSEFMYKPWKFAQKLTENRASLMDGNQCTPSITIAAAETLELRVTEFLKEQISSYFTDKLLRIVRDIVHHVKGLNKSENDNTSHGHGSPHIAGSKIHKGDAALEFIKHACAVLALDQNVQHDVLCGQPYDREAMENALLQIVRQRERLYHIQDLVCRKGSQVKAAHLAEQCTCGSSFRYWALAVPVYAMVTVVLTMVFYLGLNFMATPPPTSLNTIFDEYSRSPSSFVPSGIEYEHPIEPIFDLHVSQVNDLLSETAYEISSFRDLRESYTIQY